MEIKEYINEVWKPVRGFFGLYEVSNYGRVRSLGNERTRKEKIIKSGVNSNGYYQVALHKEGKQIIKSVHRLVAETFIPNPHNYPCINHKDENKLNNFVWVNPDGTVDLEKSNLEWCTYKYNSNYGTCIERRALKKRKTVLLLTKHGIFLHKYASPIEAAKETGISHNTIRRLCDGKPSRFTEFIFKYTDNKI